MPSRPTAVPATLVAHHLHHERAGHPVLSDVSLTVAPSTCLGVIGPNGVGKSTLLQVLAGLLEPGAGRVSVDPPEATVGYLQQEHVVDGDETVRAAVLRRTGVAQAEGELARAASALGSGGPGVEERYATALARYESLSAGDFEARLATALEYVGLEGAQVDQRVIDLSGGQEARVALAAVHLSRFDITLLDEPTNDLDFEGLAQLEELVVGRSGGMVIVSHDRAFLDRTVTDVLELDEHSHSGRTFGGGWSAYQEERGRAPPTRPRPTGSTKPAAANSAAGRNAAPVGDQGCGPREEQPRDNDKAQRDFRINRTERLAARSRRTERALEALAPVDKPWEGWDLHFDINEAARSGDMVVRLEDAVIERGDFTLGPLTLEVAWGDRVALSGPNGSGKTTLVDALIGRLAPTLGNQRIGPSVVVGELVQDRRALDGPASRGGDVHAGHRVDGRARPGPAGQVRPGRRCRDPAVVLALTR